MSDNETVTIPLYKYMALQAEANAGKGKYVIRYVGDNYYYFPSKDEVIKGLSDHIGQLNEWNGKLANQLREAAGQQKVK